MFAIYPIYPPHVVYDFTLLHVNSGHSKGDDVLLSSCHNQAAITRYWFLIKQNNHRGETSFDCFGRVREIGPPLSAEASCQVDAFSGWNGGFTFDLTNVEW